MEQHDFKAFPELTNAQMSQFYFDSPHKQIVEDFRGKVITCHDGDTLTIRTDFRDFDFPIRFANIDTKELSEGGAEARDYMKSKLEGEMVDVKIDPSNRVGVYGRLIGEIIYNGINMNNELINLGLATPFAQKNEGKLTNIEKEFDLSQWIE